MVILLMVIELKLVKSAYKCFKTSKKNIHCTHTYGWEVQCIKYVVSEVYQINKFTLPSRIIWPTRTSSWNTKMISRSPVAYKKYKTCHTLLHKTVIFMKLLIYVIKLCILAFWSDDLNWKLINNCSDHHYI